MKKKELKYKEFFLWFQFLICLLIAVALTGCIQGDKESSLNKEEHPYTKLYGNGIDRVNILLYFYGSDLEDISHMASQDIQEILSNRFSDKVNVFIETNGVRNWDELVIDASNEYVQRFMISDKGLECTNANLGPIDLDVKENLEWFISQTAKEHPAERNILILWGHGNGSNFWQNDISFPNGIISKDIDEILEAADVKFERL